MRKHEENARVTGEVAKSQKLGLGTVIAALACLLLVGCSDPRPTTDEIYASEMAESLAAAEAVYREFDPAELALANRGGAETLPEEFHQWLSSDMFDLEERYQNKLWTDGVQVSGDPHDEVTSFDFANEVELRPKTYLVAYVCGKAWGAISTNRNGEVLNDGALHTYRRTVWFTKEGSPLEIKIAWIIDEGGAVCDA
jgi:hypothetical protein